MGHIPLRNRPNAKRPAITSSLLMAATIAIGLVAVFGTSTFADPPKPAKKDSPRTFKPKNVDFTTSVDPAEAKPGQTVAFKVTAKLDPGFHIYKYSKESGGPGPSSTTFDFFDPAGLTIEGEWTASKEPEKHKDPNFGEVEFVEYHADEVVWSIKLKIPAATEPGKKVLKCQARYQVCDAKQCSIPGQWTLADAMLTVLPADGQASSAGPARDWNRLQTRRSGPGGTENEQRARHCPQKAGACRRPSRFQTEESDLYHLDRARGCQAR